MHLQYFSFSQLTGDCFQVSLGVSAALAFKSETLSRERAGEIPHVGLGVWSHHTGNLVCGFKTLSPENQPLALPYLRLSPVIMRGALNWIQLNFFDFEK